MKISRVDHRNIFDSQNNFCNQHDSHNWPQDLTRSDTSAMTNPQFR